MKSCLKPLTSCHVCHVMTYCHESRHLIIIFCCSSDTTHVSSFFHISRSCECVDANFYFSQNNDVTLMTQHGVMTQSHRKSRLAPFRAENIFRKNHGWNFGCWSRCMSIVQKCALGVILPAPLTVEGLHVVHAFLFHNA